MPWAIVGFQVWPIVTSPSNAGQEVKYQGRCPLSDCMGPTIENYTIKEIMNAITDE